MTTLTRDALRDDYDYVVSVEVVQDARRLLQATRSAGVSSAVWRSHPIQRRSILDLEGMGREIWHGVDAREYIDQLREEWDAH